MGWRLRVPQHCINSSSSSVSSGMVRPSHLPGTLANSLSLHNHALHTGSASLSTIRSGGRLTREHGMGLIVARAPVPAQSWAHCLTQASGSVLS
jgi:hypothetical protein